jgi:CheY-like chemotaxis protein
MTHILVVSSDYQVRQVLSRIGREGQFQFTEAADPLTAARTLSAFAASGEKMGAVLVDEALPHMTGEKLCRTLRALCSGVPIFMLTSSRAEGRQDLAKPLDEAGARDFFIGHALPTTSPRITASGWEADFSGDTGMLFVRFSEGAGPGQALDALGSFMRVEKCSLVRGGFDAALLVSAVPGSGFEDRVKAEKGIAAHAFIPFEVPDLPEPASRLLGAYESIRQEDLDAQSTIEVNPLERARFVQACLVIEIDPQRCEALFVSTYLLDGVTECYAGRGRDRIVCLLSSDSFLRIDRKIAQVVGGMDGVLRVRSYRLV